MYLRFLIAMTAAHSAFGNTLPLAQCFKVNAHTAKATGAPPLALSNGSELEMVQPKAFSPGLKDRTRESLDRMISSDYEPINDKEWKLIQDAERLGTPSEQEKYLRDYGFSPLKARQVMNWLFLSDPAAVENLRAKAKVSEEQWQNLTNGKVPLIFESEAQMQQFLKELAEEVSKSGLNLVEGWIGGTSTKGFSDNPGKPLGYHYDAKVSDDKVEKVADVDLLLVFDEKSTKELLARGAKVSPRADYVFDNNQLQELVPSLKEFSKRWTHILRAPNGEEREIGMIGLVNPKHPGARPKPTDFRFGHKLPPLDDVVTYISRARNKPISVEEREIIKKRRLEIASLMKEARVTSSEAKDLLDRAGLIFSGANTANKISLGAPKDVSGKDAFDTFLRAIKLSEVAFDALAPEAKQRLFETFEKDYLPTPPAGLMNAFSDPSDRKNRLASLRVPMNDLKSVHAVISDIIQRHEGGAEALAQLPRWHRVQAIEAALNKNYRFSPEDVRRGLPKEIVETAVNLLAGHGKIDHSRYRSLAVPFAKVPTTLGGWKALVDKSAAGGLNSTAISEEASGDFVPTAVDKEPTEQFVVFEYLKPSGIAINGEGLVAETARAMQALRGYRGFVDNEMVVSTPNGGFDIVEVKDITILHKGINVKAKKVVLRAAPGPP